MKNSKFNDTILSANPWKYVNTYSKAITAIWLVVWVLTLLFSMFATWFTLGDALSLQYINDNVVEIGKIICGFYFSTKCLENVAQGLEEWKGTKSMPEHDGMDGK